jgi:Zn-dependent protease with chaperone function
MGYLGSILLALGSLVAAELLGSVGEPRPAWMLALLPLPHLLAAIEHRAGVAGRFTLASWAGRLGEASPVLGQLVAVLSLGWLVALERLFGEPVSLLAWPGPALLFALAPFVVLALLRIDAEARGGGARAASLRGFHARMLLTGLGPVAGYVLFASLLRPFDGLRLAVEQVSLWGLAYSGALLAAFVLLLPRFLETAWDTEPVPPGPQRELLEAVAERAGFRCRELLVWRTGGLMANAAIVGLWPRGRRVFFTDALLATLGPRQLAAVYAHEIGHARRAHVWLFLVWALAFFGALDAGLSSVEASGEVELALGVAALALGLWLAAFGWLSRRVELDADLYCLELLRDGVGIASALQTVAGDRHHRSGWRHFSARRRIEFLGRAGADRGGGGGLRRLLRRIAWGGVLLLVVTGGWRLRSLVRAYPAERAVVDLGLGRYGRAARRLEGLPGWAEPPGAALAARAALVRGAGLGDLPSRPAAAALAGERALAALEGGAAAEAAAWLELAGLAGDPAAGAAGDWLLGRLEGAPGAAWPPASAGRWGAALRGLPDLPDGAGGAPAPSAAP